MLCVTICDDVRTQADYVPAVVFPFLSAFGGDDLGAFEASMTVLLHWGASWLVSEERGAISKTETRSHDGYI